MFTNPNVVVIATICVGLISAVPILISILAKRKSSKWHKKEEELFVSVKDSVNAHTDHKIAELEKRLTDRWDESISSIFPKNFSVATRLTKLQNSTEISLNELNNKVDLTNEALAIHLKDSKQFSEEIVDFIDKKFNVVDNTAYKNFLYTIRHFGAEIDTHDYNNIDENYIPTELKTKNCLHCNKKILKTKKKDNNRKFCKTKNGILNYCRDTYNKNLKNNTNV